LLSSVIRVASHALT